MLTVSNMNLVWRLNLLVKMLQLYLLLVGNKVSLVDHAVESNKTNVLAA